LLWHSFHGIPRILYHGEAFGPATTDYYDAHLTPAKKGEIAIDVCTIAENWQLKELQNRAMKYLVAQQLGHSREDVDLAYTNLRTTRHLQKYLTMKMALLVLPAPDSDGFYENTDFMTTSTTFCAS
jgi:hypothetical protein